MRNIEFSINGKTHEITITEKGITAEVKMPRESIVETAGFNPLDDTVKVVFWTNNLDQKTTFEMGKHIILQNGMQFEVKKVAQKVAQSAT